MSSVAKLWDLLQGAWGLKVTSFNTCMCSFCSVSVIKIAQKIHARSRAIDWNSISVVYCQLHGTG